MSVGISYRAIDKVFPGRVPVHALRDISFDIEPGELFCLLGPSGCGKTTLLRVTAGLETVSSGQVFYDDADVTSDPPFRREIGMVFQSYALYPHMSVFDNVAYGLRVRGVERRVIEQKVHDIMELVGLPSVLERNPSPVALSGGQQQRVAVARALVYDPKILLLDEPLANLDAKLRRRMRAEIRRIQKHTNITTVFVTHDQEEAMAIGDRLAVMNDGEVDQIGTAEDLYHMPSSLSVAGFIGTMNFFPAVVRTEGVAELTTGGIRVSTKRHGDSPAPLGSGDSAVVGYRPESLNLFTQPAPDRLRVRVEVLQHLGQIVRYEVLSEADGATRHFEVDMKGRLDGVGEGAVAYLGFGTEAGLLFSEEGGEP